MLGRSSIFVRDEKMFTPIEMKCRIFLCIVILMLVVWIKDATGKKPEISIRGGGRELSLQRGNELRIACHGGGSKLQFSFPESTFLVARSRHEIRRYENGTYTFIRRIARSTDTGWYACAEEGVEIENDFRNLNHADENVSWIYVYVSNGHYEEFADTYGNTFRGSILKTIITIAGSPVVIPCRPQSPQRRIELWQNFKRVDQNRKEMRFDPKIGFIMKHVALKDNEAFFQCLIGEVQDNYILRYSDPKPEMIAINEKNELTLKEGDLLRIECYNKTKLNFMFPKILPSSSTYDVTRNRNGTSTFIRSSVVSDDTGWYGCAAMNIEHDAIPDRSINYTMKEINWIYVYVASSTKIISGLVDTDFYLRGSVVIPCRPSSPELRVRLNVWNGEIWKPVTQFLFDPRVGYHLEISTYKDVFHCSVDSPVRYASKNYSVLDIIDLHKKILIPTIVDDDDNSLDSKGLIIRKTGDEVHMSCETVASALSFSFIEWTIPRKVSENRVKYRRTRTDRRVEHGAYLQGRTLTIMINNATETDGGNYNCSVRSDYPGIKHYSREVKVFDENGGRYIKLVKQGGKIEVTGQKGKWVEWLLDMANFPTAQIVWYHPRSGEIRATTEPDGRFQIKTGSRKGAPQNLFVIRNLTADERGPHSLHVAIDNVTAIVNVIVNVQESPYITELFGTEWSFHTSDMLLDAICTAHGSPKPNMTLYFLECPKFPSVKNSTREVEVSVRVVDNDDKFSITTSRRLPIFRITVSGFLVCEACNMVNCSKATKQVYFSAFDEPYFISTNLNKSAVTLHLETDRNETMILECYAAGRPYPSVTWLKDNVILENSRQLNLANDNRELTIQYFLGEEGGRYTCRAENEHGYIEDYIDIKIEDGITDQTNALSPSVTAVIVALLILIVICSVVIYRLYVKASKKKLVDLAFTKGALDRFNPELSVVDQAELLPYDLKWEYPRELLKLDKTLGSGAFGIVKKAEAKSICRGEAVTTVAVKLVRSMASLHYITALTRELKILAYLGKHPNVVNLLGACTRNVFYGELFVIVEYCRFGNMRDYLLNGKADFVGQIHVVSEITGGSSSAPDRTNVNVSRPNSNVEGNEIASPAAGRNTSENCVSGGASGDAQRLRTKYQGDHADLDLEPICTRDLVYWSWQVSRGMEYLGKRKVVHGDLAARNILLADNGIVKICDFGLAKALYQEAEYRDNGTNPLPIKWMAIEVIEDRVFSVQSDVWSFGIVMWEFFSLGETPYTGIRNRDLHQKLTDGYRVEQPNYVTMNIYNTMLRCWEADSSKRPSFTDLAQFLGDLLDDGFKTYYLEMDAEYMEINTDAFEDGKKDYLTISPSVVFASSSFPVQEHVEMNSLAKNVSQNPA